MPYTLTFRGTYRMFLIFIVCYTYAIIRYHFGKHLEEWIHFPYVINKAISWTAGTFMVLTLIPNERLMCYSISRRTLGLRGYFLAVIHIVTNVLLLNPDLHPSFFTDQKINASGWTYISFGATSFILFSLPLYASFKNFPAKDIRYKFGKLGILLLMLHVASLGLKNWFFPETWPMMMPPITLLFLAFCLVIILLKYLKLQAYE